MPKLGSYQEICLAIVAYQLYRNGYSIKEIANESKETPRAIRRLINMVYPGITTFSREYSTWKFSKGETNESST